MIRFSQVTHQFPNKVVALKEIDLEIGSGEFVFLVGASGAGKTTILRLLLRELIPTQGSIFFDEEDLVHLKSKNIPALRRRIGAVFQDFKLLPERTVKENISLALQVQNKKAEEIEKAVVEALEIVGLADKSQYFPAQLSGGESQRVAVARAIIADPDVLFADEPTGNIDQENAWQIVELLQKISEAGKTVIMATHNLDIVGKLDKRIVKLAKGQIVSDQTKSKKADSVKKETTKKKSKKLS